MEDGESVITATGDSRTEHARYEVARLIKAGHIHVIKSNSGLVAVHAYADKAGADMLQEALDIECKKISYRQELALGKYDFGNTPFKIDMASITEKLGGKEETQKILLQAPEFPLVEEQRDMVP